MTAPTLQAPFRRASSDSTSRTTSWSAALKTLEDARLDTGAFQYGTESRKSKAGSDEGFDTGVPSATLETLRALHGLHPLAISFENLDTLAGVPVKLDLRSLEHKLVHSRRGGYCFEQNLLFKHALGALGFDATALAARVVWERPAGEVRARTHMVLLVALEGRRYVCDVGFGGLTPTAPLELIARRRASRRRTRLFASCAARANSPSRRRCAASGSASIASTCRSSSKSTSSC